MSEPRQWSPPAWQERLLAGAEPVPVEAARRDPARWPGYVPRASVAVWRLPAGPVAAVWDFGAFGGSFGEDDATALVAAARLAVAERRPLLTVVRSGGTRLQEGMAALVGIPRARLALLGLARTGLPHLSVADAPTTGGVWISVAAAADLRVAVEGATVGFAGPRVVEAVTGSLPARGSHTAASAAAAGLVDAALPGDDVPGWVERALAALGARAGVAEGAGDGVLLHRQSGAEGHSTRSGPGTPGGGLAGAAHGPDSRTPGAGWAQVQRARARTRSGRDLMTALLTGPVELAAPRGDRTAAAAVGRLAGLPVVAVALAAELGGRPSPDGYRLATRAVRLAGRLGLPVLTLVDTPGADPGTASEEDGIAPAMGEALDALLSCPTPTLAVVHGEGGSGGALALAAADRVLVTEDAYFAAIGPEGAQAALRRPREECADLMRITPQDLQALGAADALLTADGAGDPVRLADELGALSRTPADVRIVHRQERWSAPLPGRL